MCNTVVVMYKAFIKTHGGGVKSTKDHKGQSKSRVSISSSKGRALSLQQWKGPSIVSLVLSNWFPRGMVTNQGLTVGQYFDRVVLSQ